MARATKKTTKTANVQSSLLTAAIYLRVSTEEQIDGFGLQAQLAACKGYALALGYEVTAIYEDAGLSGSLGVNDRPALKALIRDCDSGKFGAIFVAAIDRLSRKASLLLSIWDSIEEKGVAIVSIKERIDTSTPSGRFMRTMFAGVAELERETIKERTTAGRNERAKKDGEKGGRLPLGYTRVNGIIEIDIPNAWIVDLIFELRNNGATLTAIATALNEKGAPTSRNGRWYASNVREVLLNEEKYRGGKRGDSEVNWPVLLLS